MGRLALLIAATHYIQQALLLYYAERGSVGDCLDFAGVHGHLYGHRLARRRVDVRAVALVDDAQRDGFVERYLLLAAWVQHSCTATRNIHDIHDTMYDLRYEFLVMNLYRQVVTSWKRQQQQQQQQQHC